MKNLTKIFMAVCVALFAFACTTDPTEDRGVNLGAEGQTTLTLSLEGTKTHLGELSGEQYPLYWSEGDAIAVNGHASVALTAEQAGEANATFTFNEVSDLGEVYNIVYPAPAADVAASATEGCYPVVFASAQQYDAEHPTLVNAPLYGYANAGEGATLKHLSGVLRIAPKGEGVTLTSLVVKAGKGAISGAFDVDCATGALTAREEASNTVTVTFGEGLTLGAEATPIYVVVPAGEFGVFSITLNTATDAMALAFDSSTNAISAGRVRHFDEFEYKSNVEADGVYYIDSKEALIRFSKVASNFAPYTSAKVVATIDMTGIAWTSIEGFEHSFDGGSDKGFEIKGLTAPLFGTIAATEIKNVKLTNVNINETKNPTVAALARSINNTNAVVTNCSASGKMVVDCNIAAATEEHSDYVAGLVATTTSEQSFSNLKNELTIEIKGSYKDYMCIAGVVGHAISCKHQSLTNLGNVTYTGTSTSSVYFGGVAYICNGIENSVNGSANDTTGTMGQIVFNGVTEGACTVGNVVDRSYSKMLNCHNYGNTYIQNTVNGSHVYYGGLIRVGASITLENCTNNGDTTVSANGPQCDYYLGGLLYMSENKNITFKNCHNHGDITVTNNVTSTKKIRIGGMLATFATGSSNTITLNGCSNTGNLSAYPKSMTGDSTTEGIKLGGCIAHFGNSGKLVITNGYTNSGNLTAQQGETKTQGAVQMAGLFGNFSNVWDTTSTGVLKNSGTLTYAGKSSVGTMRIGGIVGAMGANIPTIAASQLTLVNTGDIIVTGTGKSVYASGVIPTNKKVANAKCFCNLRVTTPGAYVGMIIAAERTSSIKATNCHIGGTILTSGDTPTPIDYTNYNKYIYTKEVTHAIAQGDECGYISNIDDDPEYYTGPPVQIGTAAELLAFANDAANTNAKVELTANINMSELEEGQTWSPIVGYNGTSFDGKNHKITGLTAPLFGTTKASIKNLHLENVNIEVTSASEDHFGVLASNIDSTNAVVTNCSVSGTLHVNTTKATLYIGGLVGTTTSTKTFSNLTNYMDITVEGAYSTALHIIGCVHNISNGKLLNVRNLGNIKYQGTECKDLRMAGVVRVCKNIEECYNGSNEDAYKGKGEVAVDGTCAAIRIGGIIANSTNNGVMTRCINYGKVYLTENASTAQVFLGGIVGLKQDAAVTFDACENHGELALEQSTSSGGNIRVGGLVGQAMSTGTFVIKNGFVNMGKINIDPKSVTGDGKDIQISGFVANYSIAMTAESTGVIKNAGDITYSGKTELLTRIGGLWGATAQTLPDVAESVLRYENTGNITVTGTGSSIHVGGICAVEGRMAIRNARCYCTIITTKNIPRENIGMIMPGPPTDKVYAYNCHIGGYVGNIEDNGYIDKFELDDYTYVEYIYGTLVEPNDALSNKLGWLQDGINSNPVGGDWVPLQ